jgi:hypothetical protein
MFKAFLIKEVSMRRSVSPLVVVLLVSAGSAVAAQTRLTVSQLITASDLPVVTLEVRREGVPSDQIRQALDAMRMKNVPAHEASEIIAEERTARREHGPVGNFGAYVQSKLDAGLRGTDLAAAIRAEHAAQGRGNPSGQAKGVSQGQTKGASQAATKGKSPASTTRPTTKGTPAEGRKSPATTPGQKARPAGRPYKPNQ